MSKMRLFIAIPVPDHVKEALVPAQKILSDANPHVRVMQPPGIHLTLKFLGETEQERIGDIRRAMEKAAAVAAKPIQLECVGTGAFPNLDRPRVLWAGVTGDLAALAPVWRVLDRELADLGFPADARAFHPHLTIGRMRDPKMLGALHKAWKHVEALNFGLFEAEALVLYSSDLQPDAAVYKSLERVVLPRSAQ